MAIENDPRLHRLRAVSVLVCGVLGPMIGCAVLGFVSGKPGLVAWVDIAGVPLVVYAVVSMAVPGAVAGVLATRLVTALISRGYATGARRRVAPLLGMVSGAAAGFLLGLALMLDPRSANGETPLGTVTTITGTICGLLIAAWVLWVTRPMTLPNGDQRVVA